MKDLLASILWVALASCPAFCESPEEMAEIAKTRGQAGLKDLWELLLLHDAPACKSETPRAEVQWGSAEHDLARVAVLEIWDGFRCDVLFLGKTGLGWNCLGHEYDESEIDSAIIIESWKDGLACELHTYGHGSGCSSLLKRLFIIHPDSAACVLKYWKSGTEYCEESGVSVEWSNDLSLDPGTAEALVFRFDVTLDMAFENEQGGCREQDVLHVKRRGTVRIQRDSGAVSLDCPDLNDSWDTVKALQSADPGLLCKLEFRRILELARTVPMQGFGFFEKCASACADLCQAAELQDALGDRKSAK